MHTLSDWLVAGAAAFLLAVIPTCSQAAPFPDMAAERAESIQFELACERNDTRTCNNPRYDEVSKALSAAGWLVYPGKVWINIEQLHAFGRFLQKSEKAAQEDLWATYNARFMLLSYLRSDGRITDAQIAAWWRMNRDNVRDQYPGAYAVYYETLDNMVIAQRALPHYE
jgi:hypothetical protein